MNTLVGKISHYFDKIQVGVFDLTEGSVKIGDTILVGEEGVGFAQTVDSMQVEHQQVQEAKKGDSVGLKLTQPAKVGDLVYKVEA